MSAFSETNCFYHPERTAMGDCMECHRPICLGCQAQVAGRNVCQSCISAIRQRVSDEMSATPDPTQMPPAMAQAYQEAPHAAEGVVYQAPPSNLNLKQVFGGFGLGFLAGLVGLVAWIAFVFISNFNIAFIAVGLGWLIGIATVKGAGGRGGAVVAVMSALMAFVFCGIGFVIFLGDGKAAWDWIFGLLCLFFGVQQAYKTPMSVE